MLTRRTFLASLIIADTLGITGSAAAPSYPSHPITLIVPTAAGGSADSLGRIIAEQMRTKLGQPVIIENAGGAAGNIGAGRVARAKGDGYTLLLGNFATQVVNGAVYALPYDLVSDFEPISLIASAPLVIVARKAMPARDLNELIAWLKKNPDKASQGTNGSGSVMHLAGILFQKETGTHFQFVPYRGAGPTIQALLGGEIEIYIGVAGDCMPQVRAGSIKAYAVTAPARIASAPDIPIVDEAGLPGLYVSAWNSLWAPKGTPKDVIGKLNTAVVDALGDAAVRTHIAELTYEIPPPDQQGPQALAAFHKAEIDKWWPIIRAAHIEVE